MGAHLPGRKGGWLAHVDPFWQHLLSVALRASMESRHTPWYKHRNNAAVC
jgi:hypothetical protein